MILLAGPCVIESEESIFKIAKSLERYHNDSRFDFYFKSSFDKANRTSLDSYRGPGIEEGLRILQKVTQKHGVLLCERGSSFGYGNLVVDMRSLVIMREYAPVIFDATHSVQMPGTGTGKTGGDSSMVPHLARAAAAVGVDGFFFETHFDPICALSDGPNMLKLEQLEALSETLLKLDTLKGNGR
ncbi:hypothetical protein [Sulfuricurvum sp.]|uniref:hypothetical protein n=1 Tax=Sulfuricurvum sp. TaxID=2025608 RepID=UPI0019A75983|nr:hypothetical protein [Sulfuricurvum sp.]MBD3806564.1 hypothetical protein [Sulfuricurvum sp.]